MSSADSALPPPPPFFVDRLNNLTFINMRKFREQVPHHAVPVFDDLMELLAILASLRMEWKDAYGTQTCVIVSQHYRAIHMAMIILATKDHRKCMNMARFALKRSGMTSKTLHACVRKRLNADSEVNYLRMQNRLQVYQIAERLVAAKFLYI